MLIKTPLLHQSSGPRICLSTMDRLFCEPGILIFIFAENNHLLRRSLCPHHVTETPVLPQRSGPRVVLSLSLSFSL